MKAFPSLCNKFKKDSGNSDTKRNFQHEDEEVSEFTTLS